MRAAAKVGFADWLKASDADIICLQEFRALPEQTPPELLNAEGWQLTINAAERKGYSGVALYSRKKPSKVWTSLGVPEFDVEGRAIFARFGKLTVASIYFPNGSGKDRDNSRVGYKLDFTRRIFEEAQSEVQAGQRVVVLGDYNTAHFEIDLARPKENRKTSGFLPEECECLSEILAQGWVDTFRHLHPAAADHYTWWSQRGGARERNVGWRIDYAYLDQASLGFLKAAAIHPDVRGSDHCPISIELKAGVVK
ncbi:MAG: exodeoxyribonuclease III [Planctomycetes bacterium]|nr:exodeoxyribonuclease III [Planctomycetota bacterium]